MKIITIDKGIKISPRYYQKDWLDLDLSKDNKVEWDKAIEIFMDRIEGRYFKQIQTLDENKDRNIGLYSGFAIISLACLLIETLEQFWTGNIQTSRATKTGIKKNCLTQFFHDSKQNISNDAISFFNFFQRSENFKLFFNTKAKADVFYTTIRCGLLHQGQTKGKSLIHIRKGESILKWINENDINKGLSIQRRLFLIEIRTIYESYITELKKPNSLNFRRKTLGKKMKYIVKQE